MKSISKELMKGFIDILILLILQKQDSYAYEITKLIREKSNDSYVLKDGTLYPALKRIEAKELVTTYWISTEFNTKRKYYKITELGELHLNKSIQELYNIINLINGFKEI